MAIRKTPAKRSKSAPDAPDASARPQAEYTIQQLAEMARTTVRNIRAYQDRGLIPPPERRGRVGVYVDTHLSRLRIIGQLLNRGYTLTSIRELLEAWEHGANLTDLFGLESAVASPWTDETPKLYSLTELVRLYGGRFDLRWLMKASELGVLVPEGARFRAYSPRMIHAGAELVKVGIPLDEMLEVVGALRANVERAAEQMVQLVEHHLMARYGQQLPPHEDISQLGDVIWRLRPLVEMAVHAEVARAMEIAATRHLGDRLGAILEQLRPAREPQLEPEPPQPSPVPERSAGKPAARKRR